MNCRLNKVAALISTAIAFPLFIAAGLVPGASFGFIPAIKNALIAYSQRTRASDKCTISFGISTLGQAAAVLSLISFAAAAVMEVAALAFRL